MALTPADLEAIREAIREEVAINHRCRFEAIPDDVAIDVPHAVAMVQDLGRGDLRAGVEMVRDNHRWLCSAREGIGRVAGLALTTVVGAITAGIVGALWIGVKLMAQVKGGQP